MLTGNSTRDGPVRTGQRGRRQSRGIETRLPACKPNQTGIISKLSADYICLHWIVLEVEDCLRARAEEFLARCRLDHAGEKTSGNPKKPTRAKRKCSNGSRKASAKSAALAMLYKLHTEQSTNKFRNKTTKFIRFENRR